MTEITRLSKLHRLENFDSLPDSAQLTLGECSALLNRSRASLYRDAKAGSITLRKIGTSTRISVGDIRALVDQAVHGGA